MATRYERLDRLNQLTIGSACNASWDVMVGDDRRRHCESCCRDVHDFSRMTAREIAARTEASRGKLCARMTRVDGRLVVLPDAVHEEVGVLSGERRAPSMAAALVTAFLGVAGAGAAGASSTRSPQAQTALDQASAVRDGQAEPVLDAQFSEEISVVGENPPLSVTTAGVLAMDQPLSLLELYDDATLVVVATIGESHWVGAEDGYGEVATRLHIEEVLKGAVGGRFRRAVRSVVYRHYEPVDDHAEGVVPPVPAPQRNSRVLAFLGATDDAPRRGPAIYNSVDSWHGVKELSVEDLAAYLGRLHELRRVERRQSTGAADWIAPADLTEWVVTTVEEPRTRSEAISAVAEIAAGPADESVAALTAEQRLRLIAALLSTVRLEPADLDLFDLVRGELLAPDHPADVEIVRATRAWLLDQFRRDVQDSAQAIEVRLASWSGAAERLDAQALVDSIQEMWAAIQVVEASEAGTVTGDSLAELEASWALRSSRVEEALAPLRHQLAEALAGTE